MDKPTLQAMAKEARSCFKQHTRAEDDVIWTVDHDAAPEWVVDMIRDAHGPMSPDDWRYAFIVEALDALEECADPDEVDLEADIYTHELTAWLHSRADRTSYCDEYAQDFDAGNKGIVAILQGGQWMEKEEVLAAVRSALQSRLDDDDDDDEDDED
jgi:hypothetical protein